MNCPCDEFQFPPAVSIPPGMSRLTRQTGTFADFRRALLRAASIRGTGSLVSHPQWSARFLTERDRQGLKQSLEAIGQWRGRHPQDFGLLLLDMWAYVCDLTSFYDEVIAHESYVRTARRRDSLRKLVDSLGYVPRPAVAGLAQLAALAEGRSAVTLPSGTAFRSGAFAGHPPQVFELTEEAAIHPFLNEWALRPVRPETVPSSGVLVTSLLCQRGTVTAKVGDLVIVQMDESAKPARVTAVEDYTGQDFEPYTKVEFDAPLSIPPDTNYRSIRLLKASAIASSWKMTKWVLTLNGETPLGTRSIMLDSVYRQIRPGMFIVFAGEGVPQAFLVKDNRDSMRTVTAAQEFTYRPQAGTATTVTVPPVTVPVSEIYVSDWTTALTLQSTTLSPPITVYHGFVDAGTVVAEARTDIDVVDPLVVQTPIERPRDRSMPGEFQLADANGLGLTRPGSLDFATGQFRVQGDPWPRPLAAPIKLFGNIITVSRGETVAREFLGTGDTTIRNQQFTLKKSPLTYLPTPSEHTPSGLTSTLTLFVDGLQWTEVPQFYGCRPEDEVFVVRQNDEQESVVTFGDGVRGRRLPTGSMVQVSYRYGGGAALPPAGSLTQLAKPVAGLKGVRSPVAPYGGADAEPMENVRKYAPRSAMLLGRAVSLADLEAAAASYSGVRAAAAEWRWSATRQTPAAHVWYLADGDLTELLMNRLRSLTQPDTPIQVERARPLPARLAIHLSHNPKRFESDVLAAARTALMDVETGLLAPERLGIGRPLFRSRLFEFLLQVPGVVSVTGLTYEDLPFTRFGIAPVAGQYFDFSQGLSMNGRQE